jgi:hypothetical protein
MSDNGSLGVETVGNAECSDSVQFMTDAVDVSTTESNTGENCSDGCIRFRFGS